jgi:recombination protein RecT
MAVSPSSQLVSIDEAVLPVRRMLAKNMTGISAALGKAEPSSLLLAVMRVAHLQLYPDPILGQAYIIPRKGKAEVQLGYKGTLALAYRSPLVSAVRYGVVGPDDHFVFRDGRSWVLEHEPCEDGWPESMDQVRAAWAIIELRSGGAIPRVMYRAEIIRHKERGQGSQPAWQTDPSPMSVKTVLADACRRGPFEGEIGRAFALDHLGEIGKGQPPTTDDERAIIELQPEEGGPGAKPSDRFKAAHRQPPAVGEDEQPEAAGPEILGPTLLSPEKCANLRLLAANAGDADGSGLALEAARLCGSGSLEQVPAGHEADLMKWISEQAAPPKRGGR